MTGATFRDSAAGEGRHPAPARGRRHVGALWFGLFGAPVAWSVQTLVNLPVAAHGCFPNLYPLGIPVISIRAIGLVVSAVAIVVSLAAVMVSLTSWRRTRGEHHESSGKGRAHAPSTALLETGEGRTRFMALSGVMLSVMFAIASLIHAASLLLVAPCG